MLYMSSQMGNDGTYSLTVIFDIGVDLKTALVMVQNRVTLAMPLLPSQVQNQGITIRKKTPDILMMVNFFSPDRRYDDIYLSNYATIYVRDELLRVEGVSDITYQGQRDYSIRAWIDPQKLASRNLTAVDVANAIRSQNLDAPAGQVGSPPVPQVQSFQLPIDTIGRLTDVEQFGDIIVKTGGTASPATTGGARGARPANGQRLAQSHCFRHEFGGRRRRRLDQHIGKHYDCRSDHCRHGLRCNEWHIHRACHGRDHRWRRDPAEGRPVRAAAQRAVR